MCMPHRRFRRYFSFRPPPITSPAPYSTTPSLASTIRISLTGAFSASNPEHTTATFSPHRFIFVSCPPYFRAQLLTWGPKAAIAAGSSALGEPLTITILSTPFTPASLHFYSGLYLHRYPRFLSSNVRSRDHVCHPSISKLSIPSPTLQRNPNTHRLRDAPQALPPVPRIRRIRTHHEGPMLRKPM